jgi:hypothetical protein
VFVHDATVFGGVTVRFLVVSAGVRVGLTGAGGSCTVALRHRVFLSDPDREVAIHATKTEQLAALVLGVPVERLTGRLREMRRSSLGLEALVRELNELGIPVRRTWVNMRLMYGLRADWPREEEQQAA